VVVHWGERAVTLRCLQALGRLRYEDWFVVVIDNGCHALTGSDVENLVPGGTCIQSDENLGYSGGCNLGMREALRRGADYVWFLNNDTVPEPDALGELVEVAQRGLRPQSKGESRKSKRAEVRDAATPAIVGAKILRLDDPPRLDSIALRVELTSGRIYLIGHGEVDRGQYDDWVETRAVTGCAMLVARAACERLGGFDDDFFAYLEDADFCLRAHEQGWRVAVAPRARVHHDRPAATAGRQSAASVYYTARNHLMLMQRHGRGNGWLQAGAVVTLNVAYALRIGKGTDLAPLRAVLRGIRDYRRGVRGVRPTSVLSNNS
jgi:GT2 family glycosyltransferase